MALHSYQAGNQVVLSVTFTNATTGALATPTTITCETLDPSETVTQYTNSSTPAITNPSQGVYQLILTPTLPGVWRYRWEGTGAVVASSEAAFEVRPSAFVS